MKLAGAFIFLLLAVLVRSQSCNDSNCQLPNCRCSTTAIPGGLAARDTPQFVLLTFDDAVDILNIETYRNITYDRLNSDGCKIGVTFYVSHEYTNYEVVNELYNQGFEIALHSITHRTPQTFWLTATPEELTQEFVDQRTLMAHFANIPASAIQGLRKPFLQMSGNTAFQVMRDNGLTYDISWPTMQFINPGLWPYTLDHVSTQDCPLGSCPTTSVPGVWVIPMITWRDLANNPCSMADACAIPPALTDTDGWFKFFIDNFERHYLGNRAPFGIYIHEGFVRAYPAVQDALVKFFDTLHNLPDAFMVNAIDVVNWTKNPVPINEYKAQACHTPTPTICFSTSCGPLTATHTGELFYMGTCNQCPRVYPWVGNPYGN